MLISPSFTAFYIRMYLFLSSNCRLTAILLSILTNLPKGRSLLVKRFPQLKLLQQPNARKVTNYTRINLQKDLLN